MKSMLIKGAACSLALSTLFTAVSTHARPSRQAVNGAKYVFCFVGDGMASVQIQAAEAYLTHLNGGNPDNPTDLLDNNNRLNMNKLPITGIATTFADTQFITDSAAAVTAFCCGVKTAPGVIGRNSDLDTSYLSIAEVAQEQGKAIGVISSVSLPHATPAGCYARVNSRNNYPEIGYQASQSGFEFFGGGKFRKLDKVTHSGNDLANEASSNSWTTVGEELANAGYVTVNTIDAALAQPTDQKVICSVPVSYGSDAMPYDIDTPAENFDLAEVTACAIERLQNDPQGFFIFVEGGKIDWAGHANDAKANIGDTLAFDKAVGEALDFYALHPNETLIVVTGDHETGGLTLGFAGTRYKTAFDRLDGQANSYEAFTGAVYKYKEENSGIENIDETMKALIEDSYGLVWSENAWSTNSPANHLTDYQKAQLEAAFDHTMDNNSGDDTITGYGINPEDTATSDVTVNYMNASHYDPLTVTLTHIANQEAGLGWTSYSHTCVPVPVMALGFDSYRFTGSYDNTDIAIKLSKAMRARTLPAMDSDYAGTLNY